MNRGSPSSGMDCQSLPKEDPLSWQISAFIRYTMSEEERRHCRIKAVHKILNSEPHDQAFCPLYFIPNDLEHYKQVLTTGFMVDTTTSYHFGQFFLPHAHGNAQTMGQRQIFRQLVCDVSLGRCVVRGAKDSPPMSQSASISEPPSIDTVYAGNEDPQHLYSDHYWTRATSAIRPLFLVEYYLDSKTPVLLPQSSTCAKHHEQFIGVCRSCNIAVCPRCIPSRHTGHDVAELQAAVDDMTRSSAMMTAAQDRVLGQIEEMRAHKETFVATTDAHALKLKDRLVRYVTSCTERLTRHDSADFGLQRAASDGERIEAFISDAVGPEWAGDQRLMALRAVLAWGSVSFARTSLLAVSGAGAGAPPDGALAIEEVGDVSDDEDAAPCHECARLREALEAKQSELDALQAAYDDQQVLVDTILERGGVGQVATRTLDLQSLQ